MATCIITLDDNPEGTVNQTVNYGAEFDKTSPAHTYSLMMLRLAEIEVENNNAMASEAVEDGEAVKLVTNRIIVPS